MMALNDAHTWLSPTIERTTPSDLAHVHKWLFPTLSNTTVTDRAHVRAWLKPLLDQPVLIGLSPVKDWYVCTLQQTSLIRLGPAPDLGAALVRKFSAVLLDLLESKASLASKLEQTPLRIVVGAAIVLFIGYELWLCVYSIFFHPLSKFPGPKLAAVSQLPYTRAVLRGKHYVWVKELHAHYNSDVVRVSPNELSFIGPSAWKDMTGRPGRRPFEQDERVHGKPPNPDQATSMLTAKLPDHSRMRRVLDHAFSTKAFLEQQPVLESYVRKLIRCLREQVNNPDHCEIDLVKWFNWTTFDIVGDFSFGESFNCLENQDNHPWLNTIFGNLKVVTFIGLSSRFAILRKLLPYLIPKKAKEQTKAHFAYLDEKITKRIELGTTRPDFISPMLRNNTNGKGLTPAEIRANMGLMIVAGSESIVTVTCGVIYYMLKNPATMRRLVDEVRGTFNYESEINSKSVPLLKYLTAVINEALRLYPSTPGLPACRVPAEGSTVSGHWVAGDTGVSISQYAAFRSASNFSLPEEFIPDRWLDDPRFVSDRRDVFHPFSCGARSCIGKAMGDMEVRLILTQLIYSFNIEMADSTQADWMDQVVYLTWQKNPLIVRLTPVSHSSTSIPEPQQSSLDL